MKTFLLVIGFFVCIIAVHAVRGQEAEGTIMYEVKVNLHRTLPPDRQEMKDALPEFNTFREVLLFRNGESLYKTIEDETEDEFNSDGGGVRMRFRRPMVEYYFNVHEQQKLRAQEFFGKRYLIDDSVAVLPWKLGMETKQVSGYLCRQATYFNEERNQLITAWYSEQLKPFLGPENYNSLPGTVLMVDINDGDRVITAKSVSLQPLKKNEFKIPSSGQRVTAREFRRITEEQMQKMGSRGNMIIRQN